MQQNALGVEDDGSLTGVDGYLQKLNELLRVPFDYCVPSVQSTSEYIDVLDEKGMPNHIVLLTVTQSMQVHANTADEVFYRVGDKSKKLSFEQRMQLVYAKGALYYEDAPINESKLEDIDWGVLEDYCKALGYSKGAGRFLRENGYIVEKQQIDGSLKEVLTGAAVLLFSKNPQKYFQRARIRVIRYDGTEERFGTEMNVIKDEIFTGGILSMTQDALAFIKTQIKEHSFLGKDGRFVTVAQYPEFCWIEMTVNSVAHRDYSILGTDIQVKIFDDHFTVESPGILPGLVKTTNIREMHFSRNPKIAQYMHVYGLVKEFGEGVDRMYREMLAAGQPEPRYQTVGFMVKATILQHGFVTFDTSSDGNRRNLTQVEGNLTQVEGNLTQVERKLTQVTDDIVKNFIAKFDERIAPQYKHKQARESARNNCWQIVRCIAENARSSRESIVLQTGMSESMVKRLLVICAMQKLFFLKALLVVGIGNFCFSDLIRFMNN